MKNIIEKYPVKNHEDWRYYPLNREKFEKFLKGKKQKKVNFLQNDDSFEQDCFYFSSLFFANTSVIELNEKDDSKFIDLKVDEKKLADFSNFNITVLENTNAFLTVNFTSQGNIDSLINSVFFINIEKNAKLTVYIEGAGEKDNLHFLKFASVLDENAKLKIFNLQTSECTVRGEYRIFLNGRNSTVTFSQAMISTYSGYNEVVAKVFHKGENTQSYLSNLSFVGGNAKSILNGLLKVEENASGAKAYQTAKSYLLSDSAYSISYPQLEIENPDVECSHGSAVLSFDSDQLFYLQSRGLDKRLASAMILKGTYDYFFKEMEECKKDEFLHKGYKKIEELSL
jgi:Fe-S cluster assembly protein SufD